MKPVIVLSLLVLVSGCEYQIPDLNKIAQEQCEPMRKHGELEYDRCVVEDRRARATAFAGLAAQPSTSFAVPVGSGAAVFK